MTVLGCNIDSLFIVMELKRIDPPNCECADCTVGYSRAIDVASKTNLLLMAVGLLENASGRQPVIAIEIDGDLREITSLERLFKAIEVAGKMRRELT